MLVAVASRNPNKLRAVEMAYRAFGLPAEVVAAEKPAGLAPQPVGAEAVASGAVARARHALEAVDGAEHGVGIEAGVIELAGLHLDVTVAAIADRSGRVTLGVGPGFQVPDAFLGDVLRGVELGVLAERAFGRPSIGYREGIIGALTRGRIARLDLNFAAVAMALVPRLPYNAGLYATR
nr:MAG: NTP phosphatase [Vulcanisaeta sp. AZ3]